MEKFGLKPLRREVMSKLAIVIGIVAVFVVGMLGVSYVSYSNSEIVLRNQIEAQQEANQTVFDQVWKIIQQQAGVTSEYKDSFKEIYSEIMDKRYDNARGGALMSWIHEHNPEFDSSLYGKLMDSIEVQRTQFTTVQKRLIDLKREHDNMLEVFPSSVFLSIAGREEIDIQIVTSTKTKETFATEVEDDIGLFERKK
jgi:hypothetical protein